MAKLVKCPACDNDVSAKAAACPQCGHSMRKWWQSRVETDSCFIVGCLAIVAVLVVMVLLFGGVPFLGL